MYNYIWDKQTHGYRLTSQTGKFVANEIRPVFASELAVTGMDTRFQFDASETRPLMWAQKNTYLIADEDENGAPIGRKVAQLNNTQYGKTLSPEYFFSGKLPLQPVDVAGMLAVNAPMLDVIVADAKRRTKELYDSDIKRCDIAYIAFSGGKDSVALLDVCHRVLPLSVPVIFSDTDMELPDTYRVWEEIKNRYPEREFIAARAESSALENWRRFGPPSRTIRWCCSVHKSTPALMLLKDRLHKTAIRAMAFVGVRGEESLSRSFYEDKADGVKNASQLNRMPILEWGAHELWLYIFANNLLINEAYKKGISRVGCMMCPESSARYMWFAQRLYPQIMKIYGDVIVGTSVKKFHSIKEKNKFVGSVDWGARKSGVVLNENINAPLEDIDGLTVTFQSPHFSKELFYEWIKTIGTIVIDKALEQQWLKLSNALDEGIPFSYYAPFTGGGRAIFEFRNEDEKKAILPQVRAFLRKVSACIACGACEAECEFGAISIQQGKIKINGDNCTRCRRCYDIEKNCWRFKSMFKSEKDNNQMSGINRYNHFGLRKEWLDSLVEMRDTFFPWTNSHQLGSKMVQSASAWFQQAMLVEIKTRKPTILVDVVKKYGSTNTFPWELIWISLANNAILIKWFVSVISYDEEYPIDRMINILSDNYPSLGKSSIKDGLTSLKETIMRSPLGENDGIAHVELKGKVVQSITRQAKEVSPLTLLYGLYLIAAKAGRSGFTVRELMTADMESSFVSPLVAFGISPETFKKQCEGLRSRFPDYIETTFTHGNDEITIFPAKYNIEDILKLALGDS